MSDKDLNNFEDTAEDLDEMYVTLTFDDGEEEECEVITIFEAKGRDYIALIPVETMDEEDSEIYFYRYKEDAEGNPSLENIEADDEYDLVVDAFDELIEEADEED
ncbi:MAG: DUF1292 domain-containing protein [Lachnospiraceae bacterium]|nr:DUF1292 domain-containing protein [Lachnospiraceae bacterium]